MLNLIDAESCLNKISAPLIRNYRKVNNVDAYRVLNRHIIFKNNIDTLEERIRKLKILKKIFISGFFLWLFSAIFEFGNFIDKITLIIGLITGLGLIISMICSKKIEEHEETLDECFFKNNLTSLNNVVVDAKALLQMVGHVFTPITTQDVEKELLDIASIILSARIEFDADRYDSSQDIKSLIQKGNLLCNYQNCFDKLSDIAKKFGVELEMHKIYQKPEKTS